MRNGRRYLVPLLLLAAFRSASADPPVSGQIVNGLVSSDWPSVAMLATDEGFCSATLIGCRTALTAAHCVCSATGSGPACPDGTNLLDPLGMVLFAQNAASQLRVESIQVAPAYEFGVSSDLALLKLQWGARGIAPTPINTLMDVPLSTPATIVGFGSTAESSDDGGIKREGGVVTTFCFGAGVPASTHVCWDLDLPLGPPGTESGICGGDSGGPLLADLGAGLSLAGVHSGLVGSCEVGDEVFGAEVFVDHAWVEAQVGADLANESCGDGPQVGDPGAAVLAQSADLASQSTWSFSVPAGVQALRVALNGETGLGNDYDLYLRFGVPPTLATFDCAPFLAGSLETCEIAEPAAGTWHVLVDLFAGSAAGYQLSATLLPESPAPPALAPGDAVLVDFADWELRQIDRSSGDRAITSAVLRGSGPPLVLSEGLLFDTDQTIVLTNLGTRALLRVHPASGDRVVVSGCSDPACSSQVGSGPAFLGPRLITRDGGDWLVTDRVDVTLGAVVRVDPASGDRTLVSGCTDAACSSQLGSGPAFERLFGVAVETGGDILVADTLALLRIDPTSGNRTVVSGCADPACSVEVGSGPSFGEPIGVAIEAGGDVLVTDSAEGSPFRALFRVDPDDGTRAIVSGCADAACSGLVGSGPNFGDGLWGIAPEADGNVLVTDLSLDAVFHVDVASGDRSVLSGCVDAACATAAGEGTLYAQPLGIQVLPEPDAALSLAAGLALLALLARRRAS